MLFLALFLLSLFSAVAQAAVPQNETFKYVNEGEFGPYVVEYDGNYRVLSPFNAPFQLCFYNTTPDAFTLALRMGLRRSESLFHWVWEANRGKPVRENATLTFGTDGNLVLADSDGKIAWQTHTANKGVVGFKLLSNGNIVLHDSKGKFVWQSFDYPTDTLLVGQSLSAGGPIKLVSRTSEEINANGAYSLVMESKGLFLYYKSNNSPKPYLYSQLITLGKGKLSQVKFDTQAVNDGFAYRLNLEYEGAAIILARPKYNATLTFLRIGIDGNLRLYTYNDKVDWGAWETSALFDRDSVRESECQLPERCGSFGLCDNNQCVGCPLENGIFGWSKNCEAKKVSSCAVKDFHYYKIEGVDHFLSKYNRGDAVKENDCGSKCTKDCNCLGYFYNKETSRCLIAYDLKTLTKVENSSHVGYIKVPNK